MEIEFKETPDISEGEWENYVEAFNKVFGKGYTKDHFQQKYLKTIDSKSYHIFLKEGDQVCGACTNVPYEYFFGDNIIRTGLMVDVFILPEYRNDPLYLYRMYKALKKELIKEDIALVVAVPNEMSYSYWKNVVKWKDIGLLDYYALPVNIEKLAIQFWGIANAISKLFGWLMIYISNIYESEENKSSIRIDRSNEVIEEQRYDKNHKKVKSANCFFAYSIVDENGIKTCYLIDFYNTIKQKKDLTSLREAVKTIISQESIDIIVFVGTLGFFQNILLPVSKKFEPKHLYFTYDILIPQKIDEELVSDIRKWDFGLFNYDVR